MPVTTADFGSVHGYPLNHGGYWFRATYTGEGHTGAEASAKLQVVKAPVELAAYPETDELEAGDSLTLDGRVTALEGNDGQPQGNLQVIVDGEPVGDPVRVTEDGSFSTEVTIPEGTAPGEYTIGLVYGESANFTEGSVELDLTVVAPEDAPESIWDFLQRMLRELLDWLGSLLGGR
ncbi:Ig-like domain-containing protein [Ruania zhangjianzhongii]|uniref:Ig-like domain-containing protein n=1 Tax=Ruania zhangjianzhongii TaxID=2603206 RepID=UPI00143D0C7E|nr:Ig-like domain-containing protein [Ruania zhangjianzhongii]